MAGRGWKTRRGDLALLEKNVRVDGDLEVKGGLGAVAMAEGTNTRRLQDLYRRLQKRKMASMCRSIGADVMLLSPNHIASVPEGAKSRPQPYPSLTSSFLSLFLSRHLLSSAYSDADLLQYFALFFAFLYPFIKLQQTHNYHI